MGKRVVTMIGLACLFMGVEAMCLILKATTTRTKYVNMCSIDLPLEYSNIVALSALQTPLQVVSRLGGRAEVDLEILNSCMESLSSCAVKRYILLVVTCNSGDIVGPFNGETVGLSG
ncbi:transmembrane protein, putative [Medicago truncatula]|uniref:Transmembrane protein, putative n=1 Tax=Medicago truncatula TaxID=3880 RepID=A0A072TV63_MEDTR|nr:transmembrane protein, putative [Medicago truncatula]